MTLPIASFPAGSVTSTGGNGFTIDGPEGVAAYRLVLLRSSLKLEATTGMVMSRGFSSLKVLKQYGITAGTKKKGYNLLNEAMVKAGFEDTGTL